jgi:hypothetical protein
MTAVCHCENCQRQAGTTFSVVVAIPADSLVLEQEETLATYEDRGESGQPVWRRFCRNCGSPILSVADSVPGQVFIKSGTLADRSWLRPGVHIWCDSAQPWVEIPDAAVKIPRNPS